ncbi:MAG: NAD/NADP octopine/nopaline dehydrogenase family protein [Planctomycetota bacterium]|nr:NAD/NADP octopine/nopaline dehydrogenase family protein [Planctomycetota bacterium]
MTSEGITILGGGNTAFSVAANLQMAGASVTLCEIPSFSQMVEPILESRQIELGGVAGQGTATLEYVTTDFAVGLAENELNLLIIPAYGHRAFAEACAPYLSSGQVVVLMPGTLGSLEFSRILREAGAPPGIVLAETDTAPYVCRKMTPTSAHIWGVVGGMGLGVFPGSESERVRQLVDRWFPGVQLYDHVVASGLAAMNPVVHPAGVLLNAGRIEYSEGDFYFYKEGITPGVCQLIEEVDAERLAVAAALGVNLIPVDEAFHAAGFGPPGSLLETIHGSEMLTQLRAPGALDTRWLTEDVPYGLAAWSALGQQYGVTCSTMDSLVDSISTLLGRDFRAERRTLSDLGIEGLSRQELEELLADGQPH